MSRSCGCGFGALSLSAPSITGLKQVAAITTTTQGTYAAPPVDMAAIGKTLLGSKTSLTATIGQPKPVFSFAPAGAVIVNKTLRLASSARPSDVPGVIRQGSGGSSAAPVSAATFAADCQAQGGTMQADGSRQLCRLVDGSLFDETYNCATGVVQGGACAQQQGGGDGGTGGAKTNTALMLGGAALLALALLRR